MKSATVLKALIALLAACMLSVAADQEPPSTAPDISPPRDAVTDFQKLKYQALRLEADADPVRPPASGTITLYVGNVATSLALKRVAISVDGQPIADQLVDDTSFHSLDPGERLIRVGRVPAIEGTHTVHAEFQFETESAQGSAGQTVAMDDALEWKDDVTAIAFRLMPSAVVVPIKIALQQYHSAASGLGLARRVLQSVSRLWGAKQVYRAGEAGDPAVEYAEYLRKSGEAERAAVELLKLSSDPADARSASYWLRTAAVLREVGLWDFSREICSQLDGQRGQRQSVATERLNIALRDYDVGRVQQAEDELVAIKSDLPDDLRQDWQLAYAQILFLHDRYTEAETVLQDRDKEDIEAFRYMSQSDKALRTTAFRHYNLAVAMVHNGEEIRGLSLLDLIGRMRTQDRDLISIRDQANLALGWYFLRKEKGITAIGALGRVGSEGKSSARALLGVGWAQLAPAGEKIRRVRLDHEEGISVAPLPAPIKHSLTQLGVFDPELGDSGGPSAFQQGDPPKDPAEGLKRALLFWDVLAKGDPNDPAVEEGMLAIGYAHDRLGDVEDARQAYAQAIASLEARKKEVDDEVGFIQANGLSALTDRSLEQGEGIVVLGKGFLAPTEPNRGVFQAIDRYRELGQLINELDAIHSSDADSRLQDASVKIAALKEQMLLSKAAELNDVQAEVIQDLTQQGSLFDRYLKAAYFSAARLYDRRPATDSQ